MDRKRRRIFNSIAIILAIAAGIGVIIVSFIIRSRVENEIANPLPDDSNTTPTNPDDEQETPTPPIPDDIVTAKFLDLQPTIDRWAKSLDKGVRTGIVIYDLNNSKVAASHNADEVFNVASIYKLLFVYDGYRQIANGQENGDNIYVHTADKGDLTLSKCLDLMIRESYNGCANKMSSDPQRIARVSSLMQELRMDNTSNSGLQSTANDITKLLRNYWRHSEFTQAMWQGITDSMLNQPPSPGDGGEVYDWRQGLPAGFSDKVKVYNKVGWEWADDYWKTYADAAILEFSESKRYYIMVVLTSGLKNANKISQLGTMVEDSIIFQSSDIMN